MCVCVWGGNRAKAQDNKVNHLGQEEGSVESLGRIHPPMCYTHTCRCSKTDTNRSSQTTARVSGGQEKAWVCGNTTSVRWRWEALKRGRERRWERHQTHKGKALLCLLFCSSFCSLGISALRPQHGPAEEQLRIENFLVKAILCPVLWGLGLLPLLFWTLPCARLGP